LRRIIGNKIKEDSLKFLFQALTFPGGCYHVSSSDIERVFKDCKRIEHKIFEFESSEELIKFIENRRKLNKSLAIVIPNRIEIEKDEIFGSLEGTAKLVEIGKRAFDLFDYRYGNTAYIGTRFEKLKSKFQLHLFIGKE